MKTAEIRKEEKLLLEDLEVLVSELEHRYLEINIPLLQFLQGHWSNRMKEVSFKRKGPNLEIVEKSNHIGIRLSREPIDDLKFLFGRPCIYAPPQRGDELMLIPFIYMR